MSNIYRLRIEVAAFAAPLANQAMRAGEGCQGEEADSATPKGRQVSPPLNNDKKNLKEEQQPRAERRDVVVFSADLLERELLTLKEQQQLQAMLAEEFEPDAQALADELAGAIRARGRVGERAIKNPLLFLKALGRPNCFLSYAPGERALREARTRVGGLRQVQKTEPGPESAPMPAATRELIDRLRRESRGAGK